MSGSRGTARAHAKLNLTLRVLGREDSGFHSIETIFIRLALADEVSVEVGPEPGIRLTVEGDPGVPDGAENLCWRAAELLFAELDAAPGVHIRLVKRIPAAAGLGGGSADAAAVLRVLADRVEARIPESRLIELAGELGSDVPFGLCRSPMALAWERGRRLVPLPPPEARAVLILDPAEPITAAGAYGWLAEDRASGVTTAPSAAVLPEAVDLSTWDTLETLAHNDLEGAVFRRRPALRSLRDALRDGGADLAVLCGSGSCVAGIFRSEALRDAVAADLASVTGVRVIRTTTLDGPAGPIA